jgi:hypothetical protein
MKGKKKLFLLIEHHIFMIYVLNIKIFWHCKYFFVYIPISVYVRLKENRKK